MNNLDENFEINKTIKNAELLAKHEDALETGFPVIFAISSAKEGSDGGKYFQAYVAQKKTTSSDDEGIGAVQALFLGWNSTLTVRAITNISLGQYMAKKELQELIKVGNTLNNFSLQANERVGIPFYNGQQPVGRETEEGYMAKVVNGEPVYRTYELVVGDAVDKIITEGITREKYEFDSIKNTKVSANMAS